MDCASNVITANFAHGKREATTAPLWQWDYGQVLCVTGIDDLPQTFQMHFALQQKVGMSTTVVGADGQVNIPNGYLIPGKPIYAWLYVSDEDNGETEYAITIPVRERPMPDHYEISSVGEFDGIVEQVAEYAATATEGAERSAASAAAADASAGDAATSASGALASATAAAQSAADAAQAAHDASGAGESASGYARAAAQSAASIEGDVQIASQKASEAQTAAGQAVTAKDAAQTAQQGAETAATNAGQSASTATAKASEAATSASNAAQSKTDAEAAAARAEQAAATLTVDTALSDSSTNPVQNKAVTESVTQLKTALSITNTKMRSIPFVSDRLWKIDSTTTDGVNSLGGQSFTFCNGNVLFAGNIKKDNSQQMLAEYDFETANRIRSQTFASTDLGHCNDITYDGSGTLYVCGSSGKIVTVDYAALTVKSIIQSRFREVIGCAWYDGKLYAYGTMNGIEGYAFGTVEGSGATDVLVSFNPNENDAITAVMQTMDIYDGYAYIVMNHTNAVILIDIAKRTVEKTIVIGEGNGLIPYGEIEGIGFLNDVGYMTGSYHYEDFSTIPYSTMSLYKTNLTGNALYVHNYVGQGIAKHITVHVDPNSTSINPDGSSSRPFSTLKETAAYVMYMALNGVTCDIKFASGADFSEESLILRGVTCYIDFSFANVRNLYLSDGVYVLRNLNAGYVSFERGTFEIYASSVTNRLVARYGTVYVGGANTIAEYDFTGCYVFPLTGEDVEKMSLSSSWIRDMPYRTEVISNSFTKATVERAGNTVIIKLYDAFTEVAENARTTLFTLPDWAKPATYVDYDVMTITGLKFRFYVQTDGTVAVYNYNTGTTFSNFRVVIPYITK